MKYASNRLINLLNSNQFCIADLYTITLQDQTVIRWTNFDIPLNVANQIYTPFPITHQGISQKCGLSVDDLQCYLYVTKDDMVRDMNLIYQLHSGAFDNAILSLDRAFMPTANPADTSAGTIKQFLGTIEIEELTRAGASIRVKSMTNRLNIKLPRNVYTPSCQHTIYDEGCGLNREDYKVSGIVLSDSYNNIINSNLSILQEPDSETSLPITNGIKQWFDATKIIGKSNGDALEVWHDLSSNNYHATESRGYEFPIYKTDVLNGKPAIYFGGKAVLNHDCDNCSNTTVFVVAKQILNDQEWQNIYTARNYMVNIEGTGKWSTSNGFKSDLSSDNYVNNRALIMTVAIDYEAKKVTIRENISNESKYSYFSKLPHDASANIGAQIPRFEDDWPGVKGFFKGYVAEIIAYDWLLSDDQINQVQRYLNKKYFSAPSRLINGYLEFSSGKNIGIKRSIVAHEGGTITLSCALPYPIATGDNFNAYFGCDKTMAACNDVYDNLGNFRGFPFIPVPEVIT